MIGKVAIVTGGNSGIGLVTARELARKGAHVTLTARSAVKGQTAKSTICADLTSVQCKRVDVMALDLASLETVAVFAGRYRDKNNVLDILVLNAGVMACPFQLSDDGYELQFATNHLGHFLLTQLLMPLLDRAKQGRVVTVSSSAHKRAPEEGIRFDTLNHDKDYSSL
jgi:NAD(P)-dependent dehydrogenase (short-subunit alcohol dehydrogenase family)